MRNLFVPDFWKGLNTQNSMYSWLCVTVPALSDHKHIKEELKVLAESFPCWSPRMRRVPHSERLPLHAPPAHIKAVCWLHCQLTWKRTLFLLPLHNCHNAENFNNYWWAPVRWQTKPKSSGGAEARRWILHWSEQREPCSTNQAEEGWENKSNNEEPKKISMYYIEELLKWKDDFPNK